MTIWRITAIINFPLVFAEAVPPAPGSPFPQEMKPVSRVPQNASRDVQGVQVSLGPWRGSTLPREFLPLHNEPAALTFITNAETPEDALLQVEDLLELITDDLSFQLQQTVYIFGLEVLDVTPPLRIGESRQMLLYPFPNGYNSPKFLQSTPIGNEAVAFTPELMADYSIEDERARAALRWYIKGMTAPFEVDKFVFYWIALEILCARSDIVVTKPYVTRCNHEIPNCPVCGTTTIKEVNGPTIQKFLSERNGIDTKLAQELWKTRQMFHGANRLSKKAVQELPRLTMALRYATLQSLKEALHIQADTPPIVTMDAPSISSRLAMKGHRDIEETDL